MKSSKITLPKLSERVNVSPLIVVNVKSGALPVLSSPLFDQYREEICGFSSQIITVPTGATTSGFKIHKLLDDIREVEREVCGLSLTDVNYCGKIEFIPQSDRKLTDSEFSNIISIERLLNAEFIKSTNATYYLAIELYLKTLSESSNGSSDDQSNNPEF